MQKLVKLCETYVKSSQCLMGLLFSRMETTKEL